MVRVATLLASVPSLNANDTVRVVVDRLGEACVLKNVIDCSAACQLATLGDPLPVSVRTPVALL